MIWVQFIDLEDFSIPTFPAFFDISSWDMGVLEDFIYNEVFFAELLRGSQIQTVVVLEHKG